MTTKQVIFIDPSLPNNPTSTLAAALPPDIKIQFITDPSQLAQWSQTLTGYDAVHILSHGSPGAVRIGEMREMELEANWLLVKADLEAGRFRKDGIQKHLERINSE